MNSYAERIKKSSVWKEEFSNVDDLFNNGILKCSEIQTESKAVMSIFRTAEMLAQGFEQFLAQFDITGAQLGVLKMIYFSKSDSISQENLSKMISCSKANISSIMTRLEEKEYIQRSVNNSNKREKIVSITKKGEQKLISVFSHLDNYENHLSKKESQMIVDLLLKMRTQLSSKKLEVKHGN